MTTWVDRLPEGTTTKRWATFRQAIGEASQLGVTCRIVGADIELSGLDPLPATLRARLEAAVDDGFLWKYLAADEADFEATDFLARLNVEPVLVEDPARVAACQDELSLDLAGDPALEAAVGIDIETGADGWRPPPIRFTKDGQLAVHQEKVEPPGLSPHRAKIQTLQLYSGGERCFVFRGAALQEQLRGSWLRTIPLVAHNSVFEAMFLLAETGHAFDLHCTLQAAGLLFGVRSRSLAKTAVELFGIEPPKALQTSCWSAKRLSPGQLAYGCSDAVVGYHAWAKMAPMLRARGR
jgi:hypothetical protein